MTHDRIYLPSFVFHSQKNKQSLEARINLSKERKRKATNLWPQFIWNISSIPIENIYFFPNIPIRITFYLHFQRVNVYNVIVDAIAINLNLIALFFITFDDIESVIAMKLVFLRALDIK